MKSQLRASVHPTVMAKLGFIDPKMHGGIVPANHIYICQNCMALHIQFWQIVMQTFSTFWVVRVLYLGVR